MRLSVLLLLIWDILLDDKVAGKDTEEEIVVVCGLGVAWNEGKEVDAAEIKELHTEETFPNFSLSKNVNKDVFDKGLNKDVFSFTVLVSGFGRINCVGIRFKIYIPLIEKKMNQDKFSLLSVPLESCVFQEEHKLEVHSDYAGKDHMELPHHNKIKYVDLKMKIKKHEVLFLG